MKTLNYPGIACAALLCLWAMSTFSAAPTEAAAVEKPPAAEPLEVERTDSAPAAAAPSDAAQPDSGSAVLESGERHKAIVHFGHDSHLTEGDRADALIAIAGSVTNSGAVKDSVVAVFGDTRTTGTVDENAVAVFGDVYVDGIVDGDVVAVFGDIELGPHAQVGGDLIEVAGTIRRDALSVVRGDIQEIMLPGVDADFGWLKLWLKHCLFYGRPLALEPGLGWAWTVAFGFLGLYVLLSLLFCDAVQKCAETLENRPGHSLLAALFVMLGTPAVMVLLAITVLGIAVIPFFGLALFCASLFGKAVMLAAIGRRLTLFIGSGPLTDIAFAVLVGGFVVLGLYLVPVMGFIVYKLLGIIGLGVVAYTVLLTVRSRQMAPAAVLATPDSTATASSAEAAAAHSTASSNAVPKGLAELPADSPAAKTALPLAGFWIRMAALFIDTVLISVAVNLIQNAGESSLLILAIYGAVMWKLKGTTVGGIVCNLQVVRADGKELDWSTAIIRALGCFLSLIAAGLGFLWIALDKNHQGWHDKIAGTIVVRTLQGVSRL